MNDKVAMPPRVIAITGGTGFVGRAVIEEAVRQGMIVRALCRKRQSPSASVVWIEGTLDDTASLDRLVEGADAVLHIAGLVSARTQAAFDAVNVDGTRAVIDAARKAGIDRFVHVSSLAAREPELSAYGASKARSETLVRASGLEWTTVRPPAVFGPGDKEMLDLFRLAKRGVAVLPPGGRLSVIALSELARLLVALTHRHEDTTGETYEPDDGKEDGWSYEGFAQAIGRAVGRQQVATVAAPRWALSLGARLDTVLRRDGAKLTPDRARYIAHPDWVAGWGKQPPREVWKPQLATSAALIQTVQWYRKQGWL